MKVTEVPAQMVVAEAAIETLTGRFGFTVMVMAFDVAGLPVTHDNPDVMTTVNTSALEYVDVVYDEDVAPEIFAPFLRH